MADYANPPYGALWANAADASRKRTATVALRFIARPSRRGRDSAIELPLANNASRVVAARNQPIEPDQARFEDNERDNATDPAEEDDGKGPEQDCAKQVGKHLADAEVSVMSRWEIRHRAPLSLLWTWT
ncbi:hypothetical protein GGD66_001214 [Bradyrhizobium sp. CIR48]|uniref:hypothetical protein n=1 Tax=unclassified Bradyrhizobium TaxID=2631580 RepID=UPI0015A53046|nr:MULTISPECIES: hypothetical protein [unclassified Bradyrhizobium]MBB4381497.1 hypothetical protein [Bradyrhizobium sp. SBR1B]MBB4422688.1 hypothetical protein [Bradyrhizobium sp. CIR48]